ncbi:MAG: hypothetical protein VZR05_02890 [Lachnospiraceae bacterium]|nr:hypothetical protein [Lachnospiraceae bacterium]MEE3437074.1 hypothetical protein [Lachnospiraceae bacterium]
MKNETRLKLMFIIPSTIGVLLFMVPILVHDTWTILVKLPINLPELFVIFLERTIISLLIVCPIAHLLF